MVENITDAQFGWKKFLFPAIFQIFKFSLISNYLKLDAEDDPRERGGGSDQIFNTTFFGTTMASSNRRRKFQAVDAVQEGHKQPIYCISWSHTRSKTEIGNDISYLASCAGNVATIYSMRKHLTPIQSYTDSDKSEDYYCCVFGGRSVVLPREDEVASPPRNNAEHGLRGCFRLFGYDVDDPAYRVGSVEG